MRTVYANCLVAKAEEAAAEGNHAAALADLEAAMEYPRNLGVGKVARPQDARVYWLAAEQAAAVGDADKRAKYLTEAAEEPHGGPCEADLNSIRALTELGRDDEAAALKARVKAWAEGLLGDERHKGLGERVLEGLEGGGEA